MKIRANETFVWVDGEQCPKEMAAIEICDYGDGLYDVLFLNTKTDCMIGDSILSAIKGKEKTMEIAEEFQKKAGGLKINIRNCQDDEMMM